MPTTRAGTTSWSRRGWMPRTWSPLATGISTILLTEAPPSFIHQQQKHVSQHTAYIILRVFQEAKGCIGFSRERVRTQKYSFMTSFSFLILLVLPAPLRAAPLSLDMLRGGLALSYTFSSISQADLILSLPLLTEFCRSSGDATLRMRLPLFSAMDLRFSLLHFRRWGSLLLGLNSASVDGEHSIFPSCWMSLRLICWSMHSSSSARQAFSQASCFSFLVSMSAERAKDAFSSSLRLNNNSLRAASGSSSTEYFECVFLQVKGKSPYWFSVSIVLSCSFTQLFPLLREWYSLLFFLRVDPLRGCLVGESLTSWILLEGCISDLFLRVRILFSWASRSWR